MLPKNALLVAPYRAEKVAIESANFCFLIGPLFLKPRMLLVKTIALL
ncbi:hypothetical protein GALL_525840 [mine drainage metagenome]|uniref:Uncharacterized protein n=1 Tax=mine drainage metagenome TaxID=410659 RepID=A0A1J5PQJ0_9ZZZZ